MSSQQDGSLPAEFIKGLYSKEKQGESAGNLTTHSANIETLAFHVALIGLVYALTYAFTLMLSKGIATFAPDVAAMLWGFFFFIGLVIAFLVKIGVQKSGAGHLLDGGVQRRITGWSVDYLIVATIMAIQLVVVWKFIVPIAAMTLACGIATTIITVYLGRRLWSYNLERMVAIYGVVTGTISSGLLLLRIVDPEFKTPVAVEIGIMNLFMLPVVLGSGILVNAPLWWGWSVGMTVLVFVGHFGHSARAPQNAQNDRASEILMKVQGLRYTVHGGNELMAESQIILPQDLHDKFGFKVYGLRYTARLTDSCLLLTVLHSDILTFLPYGIILCALCASSEAGVKIIASPPR